MEIVESDPKTSIEVGWDKETSKDNYYYYYYYFYYNYYFSFDTKGKAFFNDWKVKLQ